MRQTLTVNTGLQKYSIITESGIFDNIGKKLAGSHKGKKIMVISDETVMETYGDRLKKQLDENGINWVASALKVGEEYKSLATVTELYSKMIDFQLTRGDLVLAFGGGITFDVAGFTAATYMRGIDLINVPTTLIAMVDSSIGAKNGLNLPEGKNMIGTFYHPLEVWIDPLFVRTLPDNVFADGMAEVIKYGCAFDPDLFIDLRTKAAKNDGSGIESIIYRCCLIKKQIIEQDNRDIGIAMLLNFGHTFGHCIENYYPEGTYSHGEAVAIGMYTSAMAGEKAGVTAPGTAEQIKNLLMDYDLPYELPADADIKAISQGVKQDKKRRGNHLNLVMLESIGKAFLYQLEKPQFAEFIDYRK